MNILSSRILSSSILAPLASTIALAFALALQALPARADPTAIAQLPLLNISGSGTVKPNLMLLYDNSGSMSSTFTPDYVDDSITCRSRSTMAGGTRGCRAGDPPFASPDFNKQYYNPRVRYRPPVKSDGSSYPTLNAAATSNWTSVTTDGFGINDNDLLGNRTSKTNLVTGFPDLRWCDTNDSNCQVNRSGYVYPNSSRYTPQYFLANPYYYTINVAEYCTNASMTNCRAVDVGAAAPAGYTVPAKVRWCNSTALTTCQAKYVGDFKYPRYGDIARPAIWYGTITIGASPGSTAVTLDSVSASTDAGTEIITNGPVTAAEGTDTASRQQAAANALAASIIAKGGLVNRFTACTRTPSGSVPACSTFGITLSTNNVVAVVPIACPAGTPGNSVGPCWLQADESRAGTVLTIDAGGSATALLNVGGSTNSSKTQVLSQLSFGGANLFSGTLSLARGANAAAVALAIRNKIIEKIGTGGSLRAYVGGASGSGAVCQAAPSTSVCLVDSGAAAGKNIVLGTLSNQGNLSFSTKASVSDAMPASASNLGSTTFARTDIIASRNSYPRAEARTDCAGATCTYAEEMTNFANWYGYYKTRNQAMKTAVGHAFEPITDKYNVGLVSLSNAAAEGTMTRPKPFSGTHRDTWYTSLYAMDGNQSTPIRQALHAIGKLYANQSPYNYSAENAVVQYACQQNFTFVTTDGYWNGNAAATVTNNDNKHDAGRFCLRSKGCVDTSAQSANSLADVALYWYNGGSNTGTTSLRPTLEDWDAPGQVPAAPGENTRLHMKTYALGLGVDGIMTYDPNYDSGPAEGGDFYKLITGVTSGCPWNDGKEYKWPDPKTGDNSGSAAYQSRVDDLWHAAINGHGKYFSAADPLQVIDGLREALSNIEVKIGAAAASATSTPNISQFDNDIFSATFTTVKWYGQLTKRKIDIVTGEVGGAEVWNSSNTVGTRVGSDTDSREIKMLDTTTGTLKNFFYDGMTALEKSWFDNKCAMLSQCSNLSSDNRAIVNDGSSIVGWLRGRQQHANDTLLRAYSRTDTIPAGQSATVPIVLGDIASAKPAFSRDPRKNYARAGYNDFKVKYSTRAPTLFAAANDGMLHAFDANDGTELWAYMPRQTMRKLYVQAAVNYGANHQYTVDGSPEVGDVKIGNEWRTVLVAGLNAGGRGFYALDVTEPDEPKMLWELVSDAGGLCETAACTGIKELGELGLSFGNPQFGTWKAADGSEKWAVFLTSGYNNIPGVDGSDNGGGEGWLFVIDVATGAKLASISTGSGNVATPSGLAKITAITENPSTDPLVTYVYGGDNLGQMWRFDFTTPGAVSKLKMGDAGPNQPITTRPDVALCRVDATNEQGAVVPGTQRMVAFGTGRLLDLVDVGTTGVQSAYVLKDSGSAIGPAQWRGASMAKQSLTKTSGAGGDTYSIAGTAVNLGTQAGWYVDFDRNTGERVNLDPKIVLGTLTVVTNLPRSSTACSVGGTSNIYELDMCTARPVREVAGSTLSGNSAVVGFINIGLPNGETKTIATTADGKTVTKDHNPASTMPTRRAGWRRVRE